MPAARFYPKTQRLLSDLTGRKFLSIENGQSSPMEREMPSSPSQSNDKVDSVTLTWNSLTKAKQSAPEYAPADSDQDGLKGHGSITHRKRSYRLLNLDVESSMRLLQKQSQSIS